MKLTNILKEKKNVISVEVEPPLLGKGINSLWEMLDPLARLGISWVDITYHAEDIVGYEEGNDNGSGNGSNGLVPVFERKKPGTGAIAGAIMQRYRDQRMEAVPHVICSGFTARQTEEFLVEVSYQGVTNVLAVRGDPPKGPDGKRLEFAPVKGGHTHASELVQQIVGLREGHYLGAREGEPLDFCVGGACYPEGLAGESIKRQLEWLKYKIDQGIEYLVTTMFFENAKYFQFRDRAYAAGIRVPIIPGITPLSKVGQLESMPSMFGCTIPRGYREVIKLHQDELGEEEVKKTGIDWCARQCRELRRQGAPSLHFYANRNAPVAEVIELITPTSM